MAREIDQLLQLLDPLPLECDGITRALSTVLWHRGLAHRVAFGSLRVDRQGEIPVHFWLILDDGQLCDLRARMWLGDSSHVPHGRFTAQECQHYEAQGLTGPQPLSEPIFQILTGMPLQAALGTFLAYE